MKKYSLVISSLILSLFISSCEEYENKTMVKADNLLPLQSSNWWKFSDDDGNHYTIEIVDSIIDRDDLYFQTLFSESKVGNAFTGWFQKIDNELYYSPLLGNSFQCLLPNEYITQGGTYQYREREINYAVYSSYTQHTTTFNHVIAFRSDEEILNGFNQILFADSIGPIKLLDTRGRWAVEYTLDSTSLNGKITRY